MPTGSVFLNNRTQAVRLPAETRFPAHIRQVSVRVKGNERILSPLENTWDSFFLSKQKAPDDFLPERAEQIETERESF